MNIFCLDENIKKCAQYHCDKHVVKMILEYAQLLCNAHHIYNQTFEGIYKLTHKNHPMTKWVCDNVANYCYLYELFRNLSQEYEYRYNKEHKTYVKLCDKLLVIPAPFKMYLYDAMELPLCMPDEYKTNNVVQSYRNYYKYGKKHLHKWTNREKPEWI